MTHLSYSTRFPAHRRATEARVADKATIDARKRRAEIDPRLDGFDEVYKFITKAHNPEMMRIIGKDLQGFEKVELQHGRNDRNEGFAKILFFVKRKRQSFKLCAHINAHGRFVPHHDLHAMPKCDRLTLWTWLQQFKIDPLSAIQHHGHETGWCCMCGALLTDPKSVKCGIGPVCAGHAGYETTLEGLKPIPLQPTFDLGSFLKDNT